MLAYMIHARPYNEIQVNLLEIFNESCILLMTYPTLLFTGYYQGESTFLYKVGWAMILVMIANVLVNLIVVVGSSLKGLKMAAMKLKERLCKDETMKYSEDLPI